MDDTQIIKMEIEVTALQARYMRQKYREWARSNMSQFRRTLDQSYYQNGVMWEALAAQLTQKLSEQT
jgi:hypothetical protein